jgi:arylsulfatase A-like enzyme
VNLAAHYGFDRGFDVFRTNGRNFRDNLEDIRWWLDHETAPEKGRFFLFLHGYDAHTPYQTDPIDRRDMALPEKPPEASLGETCRAGGDRSRVAPFVREYDGAIHRADRYVGKLLAELETRGLTRNTIVVLLSDHGEEFLEHDRCFHVATVHREVLHVPLFVSAPGLMPRRVKEPVSASVTIAPTILELAGIRDHPFREPSLAGAAAGGPVPDSPIVSETERNAPNKGDGNVRSLTTAGAKLIQWTTQARLSLYDAATDEAEQSPVYDAAKIASLQARLDDWARTHEPKGPSRRKAGGPRSSAQAGKHASGDEDEDDPAERERQRQLRESEKELRSLGYTD